MVTMIGFYLGNTQVATTMLAFITMIAIASSYCNNGSNNNSNNYNGNNSNNNNYNNNNGTKNKNKNRSARSALTSIFHYLS
jgi:hypothetical protein